MSSIRDEIRLYAKDEDKPILNWLFGRYRWAFQGGFVAAHSLVRYGSRSYETHRVWAPTVEGRAIYVQLSGSRLTGKRKTYETYNIVEIPEKLQHPS